MSAAVGPAVDFDPATGRLVADDAVLDVLLARASAVDGVEAVDALMTAGALGRDGSVHPALRGVLAALVDPDAGALTLAHGGRSADGRLTPHVAVLRMPAAGDGRRTTVRLHPSLLPDALARAVDLRPRPADARPDLDADALASAPDVVRWWTLDLRRSGGGGASLEVVDAADGYYVVDRGDGSARAHPVRTRDVWRLLVRLVAGRRTEGLGAPRA